MTDKMIYHFRPGHADGNASQVALLGGKGANLAEMATLGIPVPPGFTVPVHVCKSYMLLPTGTMDEVMPLVHAAYLDLCEQKDNARLLVSVRSGAPVSCPGMMDTILNVGMTEDALPYWTDKIGRRAALDCRRRLIQMLGSTAFGIPDSTFSAILTQARFKNKVMEDRDLTADALEEVCALYLVAFHAATQVEFPETVYSQLEYAVEAVFKSWNNERAHTYRDLKGIPHDLGTAVTVQAMVFGNMNNDSGSGVLFTRNASTGANIIQGEFLPNAQGEDVVAGIRTPFPLSKLADSWPKVGQHLELLCESIESHYKDMMDIEFTVEDQVLYILQCRVGKRSPLAALVISYDLWEDCSITLKEALKRITRDDVRFALRPQVDPSCTTLPSWVGIAASPGVAKGVVVLTSEEAVASTVPCILVRDETDPDDIAGMNAAVGILTKTGGATSHAAVVALALNRPCVVGCTTLPDLATLAGHTVTLDGLTGRVWLDMEIATIDASDSKELHALAQGAAVIHGRRLAITQAQWFQGYANGLPRYVVATPETPPTGCQLNHDNLILDIRAAPLPAGNDGLDRLFAAAGPDISTTAPVIDLCSTSSGTFQVLAHSAQKCHLSPGLSYFGKDKTLVSTLEETGKFAEWAALAVSVGADPAKMAAMLALVPVPGGHDLIAYPPAYVLMASLES